MAGLIRRSDIDEVRSRTNIADVVGDFVTLKSAGGGSFKGLCPFHDERSPSFHVRPQVGFYHCFGCGEGGDVFTFLQRVDHVTFAEAVERMAARIGFELHYEDGGQASDHGNRARLLAANKAAEQFFREQLASGDAEPARAFLGGRGFDAAAAERFGVGFSPRGGLLGTALRAQGFTDDELVTAGLLGRGDRGDVYDRFRSRVVWPIRDITGQTLGFGARKLLDSDNGPKYLNTPETPVYHKSQVLYGLDLARRDIAQGKQVVVVEGYTDVMACHLAGVTTAIATCGTAFGVDHIKVVRRVLGDIDNRDVSGTGEVIFTFDPDEAGQKAASRAFAEEQRFAAQTFVAVAPDGLDPCDLRLERGDEAVRRLVRTRKPMFEFMIRRRIDAHDLDTVEGRVAAVRDGIPIVADIRDEALRVAYSRQLASWTSSEPEEVRRSVEGQARGGRARTASAPTTPQPVGAAAPTAEAGPSITQLATDPATRLERDALMAMLQYPTAVGAGLIGKASRAGFADRTLSVVRDAIATSIDGVERPDWLQVVANEVPTGFASLVQQLGVAPIPQREELVPSYCRSVVTSIVERDLLRQKKDFLGALQRLDRAGEPEKYAQLQRALVGIENERRALRDD